LGVALDEDFLEVDVDELPDLVLHAESIAARHGRRVRRPERRHEEEEVALGEIARLLEVDGGAAWKRVLESLKNANYPPAS